MRLVPLITAGVFAVALSLMLPAFRANSWTVAHGNLASIKAGLWDACVSHHSPWNAAWARKLPVQCFDITRDSAAGVGMTPKLYGLLQATRVMAGLGVLFASVGCLTALACASVGAYPKGLAVIPLVSGPLALLMDILALSFYGGVHANAYHASGRDWAHAKLGGGFVMTLVGSILAFLGMVPAIVDVSLPNAKRYARAGGAMRGVASLAQAAQSLATSVMGGGAAPGGKPRAGSNAEPVAVAH